MTRLRIFLLPLAALLEMAAALLAIMTAIFINVDAARSITRFFIRFFPDQEWYLEGWMNNAARKT